MVANSVEKDIWKKEGGNVNRMEVLRNLSSLHTMTVSLPSVTESRITIRESTGSMTDAKCKVRI
jgi:hypothetical protein